MYKNTKRLTKKSKVKEEVERAKYSELIICPLIKYIYFRIKSKLKVGPKVVPLKKKVVLEIQRESRNCKSFKA